jgi:hypothetical protein
MGNQPRVVAGARGRAGRAIAPPSVLLSVLLAVILLPAAGLLAGCTPASEPDVRAAAQRFQSAVGTGDDRAACAMLSDEARSSLELTSARPCAAALAALKLPSDNPTAVQVWGDNGQVRLAHGALFLAEFPAGWKITGAGCRPQADKPYACAVRS